MPHIIAKVRTGYSQQQKARLAQALARAIVEALDCPDFDVSVGIEDVRPADWAELVYRPEIHAKPKTIYKLPGYTSPI
jgi:4-oxalocrotonate tautomerase